MLIGLTYDLRDDYRALGFSEDAVAEFDSIETIDAMAHALEASGHSTDRIGHIRSLAERLVAGDRWDLVFNIAEGVSGRSREAQVPALLEAYNIPYVMSDPLTAAVTMDKGIAKRLVRDAGIPTAPFTVFRNSADISHCTLPFPIFVKPLAEGTGKGCAETSRVTSKKALAREVNALFARYGQPVIAETFLPGREFTVGIVGNGPEASVIAVMEIELCADLAATVYSLDAKEKCESQVIYRLADDAEARRAGATALAAYHALECRDAARVDLRSDARGEPHFLEVNVLPGMHPTHSDLPILSAMSGLSYDHLVNRIVDACLARTVLPEQARQSA